MTAIRQSNSEPSRARWSGYRGEFAPAGTQPRDQERRTNHPLWNRMAARAVVQRVRPPQLAASFCAPVHAGRPCLRFCRL